MKNSPLFVLFITIFIDLLGFGLIIPILPTYSAELGAPSWVIGLIAASFSMMQFIFSPFWGGLSDRYGRKPIIIGSVSITTIAYIIFAFTNHFAYPFGLIVLTISRIFSGIGSANLSAAQAYISDVTLPENRAKSFGIIGAAFGLGFIFGPPVGGFLKLNYGIESVGFVAALLCFLNVIVAFFFLPESIKEKNKNATVFSNPLKDIKEITKMPVVSILGLSNFIFITAFSMMQITAALLWEEHYGLDEAKIGYVFMYIGLTTAIIQGTLIGKFNKWFGEKQLMIYGCILVFIGLFTLPLVPVQYFVPLEMLSITFISLGNAFLMPTITSLISKKVPRNEQGKMLGLNQSLGSLGRVIGPIIGGAVYGVNYHLPYFLGASFLLFVLWLVLNKLGKL